MNIFFTSWSPAQAARNLCDVHVRKMLLESAQMLSTAHRVLCGEKDETSRYQLPEDYPLRDWYYRATHVSHPMVRWVMRHPNNYDWLFEHYKYLIDEFHYRFGKHHRSASIAAALYTHPLVEQYDKYWLFTGITDWAARPIGMNPVTEPPLCLDEKYKIYGRDGEAMVVMSYCMYYALAKRDLYQDANGMIVGYTRRAPPGFISLIQKTYGDDIAKAQEA